MLKTEMSDEFERIKRLTRLFGRVDWDIHTPIGDDAAVLRPLDEEQAVSVDAMIEDVHFRRNFATMFELGRRSVLTAVSDLVAMGATPRAALTALTMPKDFDDKLFDELVKGIAEGADDTGANVIGEKPERR